MRQLGLCGQALGCIVMMPGLDLGVLLQLWTSAGKDLGLKSKVSELDACGTYGGSSEFANNLMEERTCINVWQYT